MQGVLTKTVLPWQPDDPPPEEVEVDVEVLEEEVEELEEELLLDEPVPLEEVDVLEELLEEDDEDDELDKKVSVR